MFSKSSYMDVETRPQRVYVFVVCLRLLCKQHSILQEAHSVWFLKNLFVVLEAMADQGLEPLWLEKPYSNSIIQF